MLTSAKRLVKGSIQRGLVRYGWHLKRISPQVADLRGVTDNPIVAVYHLAKQCPFVIDLALAQCRGLGAISFPLSPSTVHPWVRTIQAQSSGNCSRFDGSPLERYYDHFQPESAAAVLGLEDCSFVAGLPPLASPAPWIKGQPLDYVKHLRSVVERDNREHGTALTADHGWQYFGPLSREKGILEMQRLTRTYRTIQQDGYRRSDARNGDITGTILVRGGSWVCLIRSGQHRSAALAALGHERVPVRLMEVIRREEVDCWPQVHGGLYTRTQALAVFDRIFEGRPPPGAVPPEWLETT